MTPRGDTSRLDVVAFRRGEQRFAIDAAVVSFVHEGTDAGRDCGLRVDLGAVLGDRYAGAPRELRIQHRGRRFDLCAGDQLRVLSLDRGSVQPMPAWLARVTDRTAIAALALSDQEVLWLLDVDRLSRIAVTVAGS